MTETDASMGEVPVTVINTSDLLCLQRLRGQHYSPEPQPKKICTRRSAGAYEISRTENDVDLIPPHASIAVRPNTFTADIHGSLCRPLSQFLAPRISGWAMSHELVVREVTGEERPPALHCQGCLASEEDQSSHNWSRQAPAWERLIGEKPGLR